jgi:AcrR family transcriptional regulator
MSTPVRKRQSTQVRQKQIAEAARRLIIVYGSEHITVRRIAKETGISEGAVYRHFRSKRDILLLLVQQIEADLNQDIDDSRTPSSRPLAMLDRILQKHLSAIEQRRGISFLVIAEILSLGDRKLNGRIFEVIERYLGRIKSILSDGVRLKEIREDIDLDTTATLFFGVIQGLVTRWALSGYGFSLEMKYTPIWKIFRETLSPIGG